MRVKKNEKKRRKKSYTPSISWGSEKLTIKLATLLDLDTSQYLSYLMLSDFTMLPTF